MIRNGDLPIQLPPLVRAGDEISARLFNQLIAAVKRLSDRTPVESRHSKNSSGLSAPFMPLLKAEKAEGGGFTYKLALTKGYVIERRIPDDQALIYHFPTELVDEDDNPIYHDISEGQVIYVKVLVKKDGTIEEDPTVLVGEDELAGAHYKPKVFDFDGADGEHNYKIAKFEIVDEKPRLKLFGAGDNIDHYDERVTMENLEAEGDCYEVGKTYNEAEDKVEFRKLKQIDGEGAPIIKDQTDETINFKRIKERPSPARISVTDEEGAIKIHGNGAMGTLYHIPCGETTGTLLLEWDDGLILTTGEVSFEAGCTGSGSGGGGIP